MELVFYSLPFLSFYEIPCAFSINCIYSQVDFSISRLCKRKCKRQRKRVNMSKRSKISLISPKKALLVFIVLYLLLVSFCTKNFLLNQIKMRVNSDLIRQFKTRFGGAPMFAEESDLPFSSKFIGYQSWPIPIKGEKDLFFEVELRCGLRKRDAFLLVTLNEITSRAPGNYTVVQKWFMNFSHAETLDYLRNGIPQSVFDQLRTSPGSMRVWSE